MRKVFIAVLTVLMLAGCDPDPIIPPGTVADTTLTRAVLGSGSYYVEGSAGSCSTSATQAQACRRWSTMAQRRGYMRMVP